jgi:hypothetical protein
VSRPPREHRLDDGREALNFSDWTSYPPDREAKLLAQACDEVTEGEMPGFPYTLIHRGARLTTAEIAAICALSAKTR